MKLFILKNKTKINYDHTIEMIVRAEDEISARLIAQDNVAFEKKDVWNDNEKSSCEELTDEGKPGKIISDVNWG